MADAPVSSLKSAYKYFFYKESITRQKRLGVLKTLKKNNSEAVLEKCHLDKNKLSDETSSLSFTDLSYVNLNLYREDGACWFIIPVQHSYYRLHW